MEIVDIFRHLFLFHARCLLDGGFLTGNIALVLHRDLHLLDGLRIEDGTAKDIDHGLVGHLGTL